MEMLAYALISLVISYAISAAMAPKPVSAQAAGIDDFEFPEAEEGTPEAVIFGDCWSGNWCVLAVGNYNISAITQDTGKK